MITGITKVSWKSAAGELKGTVKSIDYGLNAAGDMIPWVIIGDVTRLDGSEYAREGYTSRLAGRKDQLDRLSLKVLNPMEVV